MPPGYALAIDGYARASGGIAIWGSPDCPCCGGEGCPQWRLLEGCRAGGTCAPPGTPRPQLWICATVVCTNGEPITIADVVYIDNLCWEWTGTGAPTPPAGAMVVTSMDPVPCVSGCDDEVCPPQDYYIRAQLCSGEQTAEEVWVCGVTHCTMRDCYLLDPFAPPGPTPLDLLPPNALILRLSDLGPPHTNCCDCQVSCQQAPLYADLDPANNPCINRPQQTCCCTTTGDQFFVEGRLRTLECSVTQIMTNHPSLPDTKFEVFIVDESRDANRCFIYRFGYRITNLETGQIIEEGVDEDPIGNFGGCSACGNWPMTAPRRVFIRGRGQIIVGDEGDHWGAACLFNDSSDGISRSTLQWLPFATCRTFTQRAAYFYDTPNHADFQTTFVYRGEVVENGRCGINCGAGAIAFPDGDPPDVPGEPGASTGFGDDRDFIIPL